MEAIAELLDVPDYNMFGRSLEGRPRTATSLSATQSKLPHDDYVGCAGVFSTSRGLDQQWRPCIIWAPQRTEG
jgi:hypothetical protein